ANMASRIPVDASQLYARNLLNFLTLLVDKDGALKIDRADEIIKGTLLTADGAVVNPVLAPPTSPDVTAAASCGRRWPHSTLWLSRQARPPIGRVRSRTTSTRSLSSWHCKHNR